MSTRWNQPAKVFNEYQLDVFNGLAAKRLYPEVCQDYSDGSFRIRYGSPDMNLVVYATLMPTGKLIDINECEPRASRMES